MTRFYRSRLCRLYRLVDLGLFFVRLVVGIVFDSCQYDAAIRTCVL